MNIKQAAEKFELTTDTLRYYERIGLIPPVTRNESGYRDYSEIDLNWVSFIKCMREAGVSVESLIEYVSLFQEGADSITTRKEILIDQRNELVEKIRVMQETLAKLDEKIEGYEENMLAFQTEKLANHDE
ncbi:MerR family transcriptional regulator [Exiguobacterium algae]|uniref:MerR family transcriptional regulator n=1 Tax=Exiguobacterium algae TaxID=2751250 RepID=UPI001BECA179|nr:MerR family transcriptional regulator [Exiguobacterium algae]